MKRGMVKLDDKQLKKLLTIELDRFNKEKIANAIKLGGSQEIELSEDVLESILDKLPPPSSNESNARKKLRSILSMSLYEMRNNK